MINIEKTTVYGWEEAIRGMRNPKNSWDRSDTGWVQDSVKDNRTPLEYDFDWCAKKVIGPNDHDLMMRLAKGGPVHAKYRRMIAVYVDITAPLYWWKEFDTYKVGTVANSCSTMHKIHAKEFTLDDFSCERIIDEEYYAYPMNTTPYSLLEDTVYMLNILREQFLQNKDKKYWDSMIQLLPSSYNQKRTVMLNYEVLAGLYPMRKNHKLDEWHVFCDWIKSLPYSEIIIGEEK